MYTKVHLIAMILGLPLESEEFSDAMNNIGNNLAVDDDWKAIADSLLNATDEIVAVMYKHQDIINSHINKIAEKSIQATIAQIEESM